MKKISILLIILGVTSFLGVVSGEIADNESLIEITTQDSYEVYLENQTSWYDLISPVTTESYLYEETAPLPAASIGGMKSADGATEYSTTNVQVSGVDEADFLKNDGKYIYQVHDNSLTISEVFPVLNGKVVSETEIDGYPSEMFLLSDRLVLFTSRYYETLPISLKGNELYQDTTHALVYDISDRSSPRLVRDITLPGLYENGRMIGDLVYVLTRDNPGYGNRNMPVLYENGAVVSSPSVWCPPIPLLSYDLYTLSSFSLTGNEAPKATSFLMGWDNTLYVSRENAYVAYQKWMPYWWGWNYHEEDSGEETVIHRFSLMNGSVTYEASGIVPGSLLNQFSLDEYEGDLRVATTNSRYVKDDRVMDNNVYVLSPSLDIIGSLEHLAPDERIYSARFMGDLLYLVTFKQMDPLFVIDLSNPEQPGILGELKIPGYSDYLHPFGDGYLIGIGKDTDETESGGVIPAGLKVALFDVSDLNNPREIDHRIIGERGSSSEVLSDHKAFLLDTNRSMMVLPVKEIIKVAVPESSYDESYTTAAWQGAYVYGIDPQYGFVDEGKVEQVPIEPDNYWSDSTVRRSVTMDSVLYTVSNDRIIGSDLMDPNDRLMVLDLD